MGHPSLQKGWMIQHNLRMQIPRKRAIVAGVVTLIAILIVAISRRPVLVHVFAEADCACGDYHADVTGFIVLNPLRDRSPERSAAQFLADLQKGNCDLGSDACRYALGHRVRDWKLATRKDDIGTTTLYYKLTKYGVFEAEHQLTGEGVVEVHNVEGTWRVSDYSAYF